jgi:hypothetical protein
VTPKLAPLRAVKCHVRLVLGIALVLLACAAPAHGFVVAEGPPPPTYAPPPDHPTVRAAVTRAWLAGRLGDAAAERYRAILRRAEAAAAELEGVRAAELAGAVGGVRALAAAKRLTASRMPLAFATLARNVRQWRSRPMPLASDRRTYAGDPAVYQYFPGQGMQFHPLATAGRANALAADCEEAAERSSRAACPRRRLRAILDALVAATSRRGGFRAWEYRFDYGGGRAPWVSGMAQATAAQALARGAAVLREPSYGAVALDALGAFEAPPPVGVAVPAEGGTEYVMYSFDPGLRILNGFLQAVVGLHDVAEATGSPQARRLFAAGEGVARRSVAAYDTGAWTRYSLAGREASLEYHRLVRDFAKGLCDRTGEESYCESAARFTRYETEPPRIEIEAPARGREDVPAAFSFWVSKVSDVRWSVRDRHGVVASYALSVPRGSYPVAWTPPRGGGFTIRVEATGPEGLTGRATREVAVRHTRVPCRSTSPRRPRGCTPRSKPSRRRSSRS